MKGNLRLKKLPCSSHHKKYLIGQYKSVSISGASWRARMTDIWQDLQSWSCLAPQPDGRHLIIHPRRCIILVLRENSPPPSLILPHYHIRLRPADWRAVQTVFWLEQSHYRVPWSEEAGLFIISSRLTCWHSYSVWAVMTRYLFPLLEDDNLGLSHPHLIPVKNCRLSPLDRNGRWHPWIIIIITL